VAVKFKFGEKTEKDTKQKVQPVFKKPEEPLETDPGVPAQTEQPFKVGTATNNQRVTESELKDYTTHDEGSAKQPAT
jgi:hypothetical protein